MSIAAEAEYVLNMNNALDFARIFAAMILTTNQWGA